MSDTVNRRAFLAFTAAGRRLALPLNDVLRVVPLPLLETPVGAPAFLEGFFDFRGNPVAVLRLDRLLHLGEQKLGFYSPLLVLKKQEPAVALHISGVTTILKLAEADIQPIGKDETFNACVIGRISDRGETIYLLSSDDILLAEERARIAAHRVAKKRRLDALTDAADEAVAHAS